MDYFDWLCMIAIPDGEKRATYAKLLLTMMDIPFRWSVRRDENRALDGLELRSIFEEETGEACCQGGPCTVLEMMVALAVRCNDEIMYDPDDPKRADVWFWAMIENLELDSFVDKNFDKTAILAILDRFLDRKYEFVDKNVKFSPFPSRFLSTDFCKMELWFQLNHWIMDHFSGDFG